MADSSNIILCGECKMWKNIRRNSEGRRFGTCEFDGKKHYRTHICEIMDSEDDSLEERIVFYDRAGMYPGQIAQRLAMQTSEVKEILNKHKNQ